VRQFIDYYVANAERLAPRVGYVPLPAAAYATLAQRVAAAQTGTAFGGRQDVGASVQDILQRPLSDVAKAAAQ
jgi:phosphate transport system substrate-binding protein